MYDNLLKYLLPIKDLLPVISNVVSIISGVMAIITFLFVVIKCIANYKYGKKCEEKFKIPHEIFSFNIEEVFIEIFDYVKYLIIIIFIVILLEYLNEMLHFPSFMSLLPILLLYTIISVVICKEYIFIRIEEGFEKNLSNDCCKIIYNLLKYLAVLLIPFVLSLLYYIKKINMDCIVVIMIIGIVISAILLFCSYSNVDKKKFDIVKYNDELVAILGHCKEGFIIINIESKDEIYKVKKEDIGNYRIVNKVSLLDRKSGIIEVCNEGG